MNFKTRIEFQARLEESSRVMTKYPDRIPVICEKSAHTNKNTPNIDKTKYLVPVDLTVGQFMFVLRKHIKMLPEQALYLFVGESIPPNNELIRSIYAHHRDPDGFLYMVYAFENTFG
jgi:GABA(A) receptor-associated protein